MGKLQEKGIIGKDIPGLRTNHANIQVN